MFKKIFAGILFIVLISNAQEFFVEHQKIEGKLNSTDLMKQNFGRYDGFQLPLNKGERAHFIVYSEDFSPSIVLVTPDDKKFQQAQGRGDAFVSMGLKVPESGEWVLYVVGDSAAQGDYLLQYSFADSASLFLNSKADFCTGINYLIAHSNAYFIFPQTVPSKNSLYQIEGALDVYINGDDASYNAVMYEGNSIEEAKTVYEEVFAKIKNCVPKDWQLKESKVDTEFAGVESYAVWNEKTKSNPRIIRLTLLDNSETEAGVEYPTDYTLELLVMRY